MIDDLHILRLPDVSHAVGRRMFFARLLRRRLYRFTVHRALETPLLARTNERLDMIRAICGQNFDLLDAARGQMTEPQTERCVSEERQSRKGTVPGELFQFVPLTGTNQYYFHGLTSSSAQHDRWDGFDAY